MTLDRTAPARPAAATPADRLVHSRVLHRLVGALGVGYLALRLPGDSVAAEGGALRIPANILAEVQIQRFEAGPDGVVELLAQAAVRPRNQDAAESRTLRFRLPPAAPGSGAKGPDAAGVVAAMDQALGQLADALAGMIAAMPVVASTAR